MLFSKTLESPSVNMKDEKVKEQNYCLVVENVFIAFICCVKKKKKRE